MDGEYDSGETNERRERFASLVIAALLFGGSASLCFVLASSASPTAQAPGSAADIYPVRVGFAQDGVEGEQAVADGGYPVRLALNDLFRHSVTQAPGEPVSSLDGADRSAPTVELAQADTSSVPAPIADDLTSATARRASAFVDAFRKYGLLPPEPAPQKAPVRNLGSTKLLAVDFNLDKARAVDNALEIRTAVHADGVTKGKVALRVVNDSTIMISSSELAGLFEDSPIRQKIGSLAKSGQYVDFDTLRAAGFDVRYDAARDRIVMSSHKS